MIKRFIAALLVLTVTFFGCIQPSYAAPHYNRGSSMIQGQDYIGLPVYSNPVENCWNNHAANAAEEVGCGIAKGIASYGTITLACYALDAAATTVFPPAIAAAPVCNFLGAGGGVAAGGGSLFDRLKTVMP